MASGGAAEARAPAAPKPPRSLFELPSDFFNSSRILSNLHEIPDPADLPVVSVPEPTLDSGNGGNQDETLTGGRNQLSDSRWTCNTCNSEFESLLDQRAHFKSDLHRLNVKLNMSGKRTIKEEEFDTLGNECSFEEFDVSSISGSDEEDDKVKSSINVVNKRKIYVKLSSGDTISLWSSLVVNDSEALSFEKSSSPIDHGKHIRGVTVDECTKRLKCLTQEPRDKTHLRIVLLARGGHFAGCVFDGNSLLAHKTFHRYVVRAKSGKRQSAKDGTGKVAHSAGSSLRRHNEAALKKEIQELIVNWKSYFKAASCIFVHAPSNNSEVIFGENDILTRQMQTVKSIPLTVRRPILKEATRVYNILTSISYIIVEENSQPSQKTADDTVNNQEFKGISDAKVKHASGGSLVDLEHAVVSVTDINEMMDSSDNLNVTPLHQAAQSGDVSRTLELLEEGLDPSIKDSRGRTPYMLAKDKEVRNAFRRFMASNPDKWDWHAANVPSPLTKEMEESQAAKQAEKDAKRKAKAKELKKLKKAKEKAQTQATQATTTSTAVPASNKAPVTASGSAAVRGRQGPPVRPVVLSEEERKRELVMEREKRAAAAERRITAMKALSIKETDQQLQPGKPETKALAAGSTSSGASESGCSCCGTSLAGKVPFHRYHYKYCSTTCMFVHKEALEDE